MSGMPHRTNQSFLDRQLAASSSAMMRPTGGGVSLQHRLPDRTSPTSSNLSSHISPPTSGQATPASLEYMKKSQVAMDHQREAFEEERALWKIERGELLQRITSLEISLQQAQSGASTPHIQTEIKPEQDADAPPPPEQSSHSSTSSTGSEIWRGSNPFQNPTRAFSESSSSSNKPQRLASIAESSTQTHTTSPPARRVSINPLPKDITQPQSVSGAAIDKNLDGINFKSSGLSPDVLEKVMSESPSPRSSPSLISPATASEEVISPLTLPNLRALKKDPYTMDAGHTPLARGRPHPLSAVDGMTSTGHSSDGVSTPTAPPKDQGQPQPGGGDGADDQKESVKPPSERRDSYFPVVQDEEPTSPDADPELQGPLGLTGDAFGEGGGNDDFLEELNSKLMRVEEREETPSEADTDAGMNERKEAHEGKKQRQEGSEEPSGFEQPEHEPRLRLKRSMNFGSQLGGNTIGQSF